MNEHYEMLNTHFVMFWSAHKRHCTCDSICSEAFVTDGFQKPSHFICGNSKKTIHNEELRRKHLFNQLAELNVLF